MDMVALTQSMIINNKDRVAYRSFSWALSGQMKILTRVEMAIPKSIDVVTASTRVMLKFPKLRAPSLVRVTRIMMCESVHAIKKDAVIEGLKITHQNKWLVSFFRTCIALTPITRGNPYHSSKR